MNRTLHDTSPAHMRNLRLVHGGEPYDQATERRSKRDPVVLDGFTAAYVLAHLEADTTPVFPEAHTEAIANLRTVLHVT